MTSKPRVLIVDDDTNILNGLRRLLRGMSSEWEMTFIDGAQQALVMMELAPFDVVVSDMRMPQIDGAQLLSEIQQHHPGTVRVILSGYADQDSILRTVGSAHQYVAKPSDATTIIDIIRRTLELRRLVEQDGLRRLAAGLCNLPSPSDLYLRLVTELQSTRASAASVAEIISRDVAMSAEVLKMTNSSFFALSGKVSTPLQAVRILGFETIKALVMRTSLFRQFSGAAITAPLISSINDHSMAIAGVARIIAKAEGMSAVAIEHAFAAGMLSHIGSLVLLDNDPRSYARALMMVDASRDMASIEREMFGASHAELGAYLLGLWGFPEPVVEAVAYCLRPSECVCRKPCPLTALHAAKNLGPAYPLTKHAVTSGMDQGYIHSIGLSERAALWPQLISGGGGGVHVGQSADCR